MSNLDVLCLQLLVITVFPRLEELAPIVLVVPCRVFFVDQLFQWLHIGVTCWPQLERDGKPVPCRVDRNPVLDTLILIIAPNLLKLTVPLIDNTTCLTTQYALKKCNIFNYLNDVADIDDKRIGYRLDPNPIAVWLPFHIEATSAVLIKHSKGTTIFVAAETECKIRIGAWRVVIQPNECRLFLKEDIQSLCW